MSKQKVPRLLRPWLKPTELERTPTDESLDQDINYATYVMHSLYPVLKHIVKNKVKRAFMYRWKYMLYKAVVFAIFVSLTWFCVKLYYRIEVRYVTQHVMTDTVYVPDSLRTMDKFLYHLGASESSNRYDIESPHGMLGYWQFEPATLKYMGINVSKVDFLNSPLMQRATMMLYLKRNKEYFARDIARYSGTYVGGILMTESGILAGAHLKPSAMKAFLNSNGAEDGCDGNGTRVSVYLKKFAGYRIVLE